MLFIAEINFIVPPKSNRYLQTKNGNRFIPKKIRDSIDDAVLILSLLRKQTIDIPCQLYIKYTFPDKRRRDVDNMNKTLQDCLQKSGIVKDDSLFYRTISEKTFKKGVEKTEIFILDLSQPIFLLPLRFTYDSYKRKKRNKFRIR